MVGSKPYFDTLPIADMFVAAGVGEPPWWRDDGPPQLRRVLAPGGLRRPWSAMDVAALGITGWYDLVLEGAIVNFAGMQRHGASEAIRRGQELIVGPWAHWVNVRSDLDGVEFGAGSLMDLHGYVHRLLRPLAAQRRWRAGREAVRIFVMGANEWWEAETWPLPEAEPVSLYLRRGGDGQLALSPSPGRRGAERLPLRPARPRHLGVEHARRTDRRPGDRPEAGRPCLRRRAARRGFRRHRPPGPRAPRFVVGARHRLARSARRHPRGRRRALRRARCAAGALRDLWDAVAPDARRDLTLRDPPDPDRDALPARPPRRGRKS